MKPFNYHLPTRIVFEKNLDPLAYIGWEKAGRVALLCGRHWARNSGRIEKLQQGLAQAGTQCRVFDGIPPEPFSDDVDRFAEQVRKFSADLVVAVGGGSVLDLAKFVAYQARNYGKCADFDGGQPPSKAGLPLIAIPTTAGTGSEVTPYSVINNRETGKKFTISSPFFFPKLALIDPLMQASLPLAHRLATGLDAWVHCFEARLSHTPHPLAGPAAAAGIGLVYQHLSREPELSEQAMEGMALAALYGGLAITHARTGLVHTLSVALAKHLDMPHGLLNAVIAPHVLAFNLEAYPREAFAILAPKPATHLDREQVLEEVKRWLADLGVPERVPLARYDETVRETLLQRVRMDKGLAQVNPKPISDVDLLNLLDTLVTTEAP